MALSSTEIATKLLSCPLCSTWRAANWSVTGVAPRSYVDLYGNNHNLMRVKLTNPVGAADHAMADSATIFVERPDSLFHPGGGIVLMPKSTRGFHETKAGYRIYNGPTLPYEEEPDVVGTTYIYRHDDTTADLHRFVTEAKGRANKPNRLVHEIIIPNSHYVRLVDHGAYASSTNLGSGSWVILDLTRPELTSGDYFDKSEAEKIMSGLVLIPREKKVPTLDSLLDRYLQR